MAQIDCWSCKQLPRSLEDQLLLMERGQALSGPLSDAHSARPPSLCENKAGVRILNLRELIKRGCQKVGRNISDAMAALASSKQAEKEEWRKVGWSLVIKTLMQQHPGSQLPERLISSIRRHFDSLPVSYARAGFNSEQVFLHIRLLDQARLERSPNFPVCVRVQPCGRSRFSNSSESSSNLSSPSSSSASWDDEDPSLLEAALTFACSGGVSKSAIVSALQQADVSPKRFQLFEKKAASLAILVVQGSRESIRSENLEAVVRKAVQKFKSLKLNRTFGGGGAKRNHARVALADGETTVDRYKEPDLIKADLDVDMRRSSFSSMFNPSFDLTFSENIQVLIDEKQGIVSGSEDLRPWLLDRTKMEVGAPLPKKFGKRAYRGVYDGCEVLLKQLNFVKATESIAELELRREVLDLDAFPHKNILPTLGIFIDRRHRLYAVNKFAGFGSLREFLSPGNGARVVDVIKLAIDIAEGMQFLHYYGIVHRDLTVENIFIDNCGSAIIGGLDVAQFTLEDGRMAHETGNYQSIAPEVLRAAHGRPSASPKNNVYSFGIILWEMITSETPYAEFAPAQAALAVAMHGLRPTIPANCYPPLRYLMHNCWSSSPSDRPDFTTILEILHRAYKNLSRSSQERPIEADIKATMTN